MKLGIRLAWAALGLAATLSVTGCGDVEERAQVPRVTLVLGAYTTPREAYGEGIIPAFQEYWKTRTGQDVVFRESYQGSGAQARAIVGGFEADVAALSLEADVDKLTEAGLITHDWRAKPHGGMITNSIAVMAVRAGNPKGIRDWADLARPGVEVLTPDPQTSGGAQWNVAALYGAALRGHAGVPADNPQAAFGVLQDVLRNVRIMDKGARESITNFERGVGDVAITYENEVQVAQEAGEDYEYVVPTSTILIENPVAVVDVYADRHGVREVADAFVDFLWRQESQRAFAENGYRPVDPTVAREFASRFPEVQDLWGIDALGGWTQVRAEIFGPRGIFTRAFQELHGS
ncbi:MAG TPA: sulfate ABC transporter substrate-binding protein [Gemmatimonadota bacterium]|nr:sulfate ABC transporter substrate-binding protein [Gemmatimonadota bacterium]